MQQPIDSTKSHTVRQPAAAMQGSPAAVSADPVTGLPDSTQEKSLLVKGPNQAAAATRAAAAAHAH